MTEINKHYIDPHELMQRSLQLAEQIFQSKFNPDVLISIERGGSPIAIAIHELYQYFGNDVEFVAVRAQSYSGIDSAGRVKLSGLELQGEQSFAGKTVLLVDDVLDSGHTIDAILTQLEVHNAGEARVATPYYKPARHQAKVAPPDYFVVQTDDWLIFPHELVGLTAEEIAEHKSWASAWIENIAKLV